MEEPIVLLAKRNLRLKEIAAPYEMGEEIGAKFTLQPGNWSEARRFIELWKQEGYEIEAS